MSSSFLRGSSPLRFCALARCSINCSTSLQHLLSFSNIVLSVNSGTKLTRHYCIKAIQKKRRLFLPERLIKRSFLLKDLQNSHLRNYCSARKIEECSNSSNKEDYPIIPPVGTALPAGENVQIPQSSLELEQQSPEKNDKGYLNLKEELKRQDQISAKEKDLLKNVFPLPKNTLHNAFMIISSKLKTQHKVEFKYKPLSVVPSCWQCSLKLSWPSVAEFTCLAATKSEAATRTSLKALKWLQSQGKIDANGEVNVYGYPNEIPIEIDSTIETQQAAGRIEAHEQAIAQGHQANIQEESLKEPESNARESPPFHLDNTNKPDAEYDAMKARIPFPRNTVNNVYNALSKMLDSQQKEHFKYQIMQQNPVSWLCTLVVPWPTSTQFTCIASSKAEAGDRAALDALGWLQSQGIINDQGKLLFTNRGKGAVATDDGTQNIPRPLTGTRPIQFDTELDKPQAEATFKQQQPIPKKTKKVNNNKELEDKLERLDTEFAQTKRALETIFPFPKNNLHNAYAVISSQLGEQHKANYSYKQISSGFPVCWECTVTLPWPTVTEFTCMAGTKTESALRASLEGLKWLQAQKKINSKGEVMMMVQMNKQAVRSAPIAEIQLSAESFASIENIVNRYYEDVSKIQADQPLFQPVMEQPEVVANDTEAVAANEIKEEDFEFDDIESLPIQRNKRLSAFVADRRDQELFQRYQRIKDRRDCFSAALPIDKFKEEIIQLVNDNRVVVVKGEPGCGKSTQVPQYLMEWHTAQQAATDCSIVVTQPRRISAISLADRVAYERDEMVGDVVGYQVRLNAKHPKYPDGFILFCSTGLLVRKIISDPELSGVTHVIVDEAHERDTQVDFLLLLLKRALELNPSLKVIVMSATINAELFTQFFNNCPSISIPGFTHPVKEHFLDNEIKTMLQRRGAVFEHEDVERPSVNVEAVLGMVTWIHEHKPEGAILVFLPGWLEIRTVMEQIAMTPHAHDFLVVPAHSKLSPEEQRRIFIRPPDGRRKVILSTNIAETSLTINDVVYVVDSGAVKEERMDLKTGLVCLDNQWASQANVLQRRGRAGRVQPGESYHLLSKEKFDSLDKYPIPEINRIPLTRSVLDVKMYTKDEDITQFLSCLPEPPRQEAVAQAVKVLQEMGALDDDENLTALGKRIYRFPLDPYLAKTLVHACLLKCVSPMLSIVTLLAADYSIFENTLGMKSQIRQMKQKYSPSSDHIATTRLYHEWEHQSWVDQLESQAFCEEKGLIPKNLDRTKQLRNLHAELLKAAKLIPANENVNDEFASSNKFAVYDELIKGILLTGLGKILVSYKSNIRRGLMMRTLDGTPAIIGSESVNSKFRELPTPFLTYFKSMSSTERRAVMIHESSLLSPVCVALFLPGVMTLKNMAGLAPGKSVISIEGPKPISIVIDQKEGEQLLHLRQVISNVVEYLLENEGEPKDIKQYETMSQFRDDLMSTLANLTNEQGANIDYTEDGELRTEPTFARTHFRY